AGRKPPAGRQTGPQPGFGQRVRYGSAPAGRPGQSRGQGPPQKGAGGQPGRPDRGGGRPADRPGGAGRGHGPAALFVKERLPPRTDGAQGTSKAGRVQDAPEEGGTLWIPD